MKIKIYKRTVLCKLAILLLFMYIVLGNCATYNFGNRLPLKLAELFGGLIVPVCIIVNKRLLFVFKTKTMRVMSALFIYNIFVLMLSGVLNGFERDELLYGALYAIRLAYTIILVAVICSILFINNVSKDYIINLVIWSYIVVCLIGCYQLINYPIAYDWYEIFYDYNIYWPNPDPHQNRLVSTYFDPNYLGCCLVFPVALVVLKLKTKPTFLDITLLGFILLCVVLTSSRSGFVAIAVIMAFLLWDITKKYAFKHTLNKKIMMMLAVLLVLIILMITENVSLIGKLLSIGKDASGLHRLFSWREMLRYLQTNNIAFGIGYNMLGALNHRAGLRFDLATSYGADSSILIFLLDFGIIGTFFFVIHLVKSITSKDYIKNTLWRNMYISILVASLIVTNFNNLIFNSLWLVPFFVVCFVGELWE